MSTDTEKALDTIRNPLMICVLRKPAIEESFLDSVNNTQTGPLPQQAGNRVRGPVLTGAVDTALQVLACAVKQGKEVKGIEMQKKMKIAFIHDDLIPYLENPDITNNKWV